MLFLFPQSLSCQSLLPLLPVFHALPGTAPITPENSITWQETPSSLQMNLMYTQVHMHTDTYIHVSYACSPVGSCQVHATLLSFDTNSPPYLQHTRVS